MNTLDYFIPKADSIEVMFYSWGSIYVTICMERSTYGRIDRAIEISKDEKGVVEVSCYEDWGGDGHGSASILDDELLALIEFIPAFKAGQDQISQVSSILLTSVNDSFKMTISDPSVEFIFNNGTCDQYSCVVFRNQELHFEGALPERLIIIMQSVARLIWEKE